MHSVQNPPAPGQVRPLKPRRHPLVAPRQPDFGRSGGSYYIPAESIDAHLPLRITQVGVSWWLTGEGCRRPCSPIMAVEFVLRGTVQIEQDGILTRVGAHEGFILRRGCRHAYHAVDDEVHKIYVGLDGPLAELMLNEAPPHIRWRDPPLAERLIRRIHRHCERRTAGWQAAASQDAYALLLEVVQAVKPSDAPNRSTILEAVLPVLESPAGHTRRIEDLARLAGVSPAHLYRIFMAHMGTTPRQYANGAAMRKAQHLLRHTTRTCGDIAREMGYSPLYFSAVFRRIVGMSPMAFRDHQTRS